MRRVAPLLNVLLIVAMALGTGCHSQQPFYFHEDGDLSHYKGMATEIEYPDVEACGLDEVDGATPPLTLAHPEPNEIWELSLEDAVRHALANSKVMRNLGGIAFSSGGVQGTATSLLNGPDGAMTVYEPALVESNPRFGVEAALSAFDAEFTNNIFWEKNNLPQNRAGVFTEIFPQVLRQDVAGFEAGISKTAATGGTWSLSHKVDYEKSNVPIVDTGAGSRLWWSDFTARLEAEFRQPLFQGAGVQFNRIAGPGAIPGYNAGVMIARVNNDQSLADFEAGVRDLVMDVEKVYWELYFAYRRLDAAVKGRDSSLETWRKVHALWEEGAEGGGAQEEAQARQQYFLFLTAVQQSQSGLYATESHLRYMMGLAATDGRLIRPKDEPTTAKVEFDWYSAHCEALARNVEVRKQKWRVKERELELIASKNYLLPRVDAVGLYRWRGLGNRLLGQNPTAAIDPENPYGNAYASMTGGRFQEWQLGVETTFPIGFRKAKSGVRYAQLQLAREHAVLEEQELELSHQLANAVRDLDRGYILSHTNFNRRVAAKTEVKAVAAAYETGTATLDLLLDAQRRLAEAESDYYRSLVEYNQSIAMVHLRKGSLLEYNNVYLTEGPWPNKAYYDAHGRARCRDASLYLDYGFTRPSVVSRGPIDQRTCYDEQGFGAEGYPPTEGMPETIPTPLGEEEPASLPNPAGSTDDLGPQAAGPRIDGPLLGDGPAASVNQEEAPSGKDVSRTVGSPGSSLLAGGTPEKAAGQSAVRKAQHVEVSSAAESGRAQLRWTGRAPANSPGTIHEPDETPSLAQADRPSPGWNGAQR